MLCPAYKKEIVLISLLREDTKSSLLSVAPSFKIRKKVIHGAQNLLASFQHPVEF